MQMLDFFSKYSGNRRGFTLIEILVVVAIIALLAGTVLVGLGAVTQKGRDARRISDMKSVQLALELYFTKTGVYPQAADWPTLQSTLKGAGIGVTAVPDDPRATQHYQYAASQDGTTYKLATDLEDLTNPVLTATTADHDPSGLLNCSPPKRYCVSP